MPKKSYERNTLTLIANELVIIVGVMTFKENIYDGKTLEPVLNQVERMTGLSPKTATVDRGYQGTNVVGDTEIIRPKPPLKRDSAYQKAKKRKHCRRRAAIEPIIGHIKNDHLAARNFLKGVVGDAINFMMAASAFNFKKLMKKLRAEALWLYFEIRSVLISNILIFVTPSKSSSVKFTAAF